MPAEYGTRDAQLIRDVRRLRPALPVRARSSAGASSPSEAADDRLRRGVERRRRADGRGQHSPGGCRPAAVQFII